MEKREENKTNKIEDQSQKRNTRINKAVWN